MPSRSEMAPKYPLLFILTIARPPSPVYCIAVVMSPGQKFLNRIGSGQFFIARVSHVRFGCQKIPPKNVKFVNFSC